MTQQKQTCEKNALEKRNDFDRLYSRLRRYKASLNRIAKIVEVKKLEMARAKKAFEKDKKDFHVLQSAHAFLNLSTFANLKYPDIEAVVVDWANNMKDDEMHPKCKEEVIILKKILQYEACIHNQKKQTPPSESQRKTMTPRTPTQS